MQNRIKMILIGQYYIFGFFASGNAIYPEKVIYHANICIDIVLQRTGSVLQDPGYVTGRPLLAILRKPHVGNNPLFCVAHWTNKLAVSRFE